MSEAEVEELKNKIDLGLSIARQRMLKEKAIRNLKIVISQNGKIKEVSARYLYRKLYGSLKN